MLRKFYDEVLIIIEYSILLLEIQYILLQNFLFFKSKIDINQAN